MIRLRHLLFALFAALTILPVLVFWFWSHTTSVGHAFDEVKDRHLLLASNLGAALQRYHRDVTAIFDQLANDLEQGTRHGSPDDLLANLGFRHLCLVDRKTGKVIGEVSPKRFPCPETAPEKRLRALEAFAADGETRLTPVMAGPGNQPTIFAVRSFGDHLAVGALNTDYFVQLGKAISFGVKGHAAIVDQEGNVLAHPLDSWIAERKNIAKVSAVARMLAGETGIEQFYSPALKGDMIAGFTVVDGPGWGVMIPQPVTELYDTAAQAQRTALILVGVSFLVVVILAVAIAWYLSRPLEQIVAVMDSATDSHALEMVKLSRQRLVPREFRKVEFGFNRMVGRLRENLTHIKHLAFSDTVTDLPNRESFRLIVENELERLAAIEGHAVMLLIDLDEFKAVNDTVGHDGGDIALQMVSGRLAGVLRKVSGKDPVAEAMSGESRLVAAEGAPVIARLGGDEFAVLIPDIEPSERLTTLLRDINRCLSDPVVLSGETFVMSGSVGAAVYPDHGSDHDALLKRSDIAMYYAKRAGKNRSQIYDAAIGAVTIGELRRNVSAALRDNQFLLHYQPKISTITGCVTSVEALIRWNHPDRGMLYPIEFIPMIENTDVILELGEWVLKAVASDILSWKGEDLRQNVSVNISARHFSSKGFADRTIEIIDAAGVDRGAIELEITEEAVMSDEVSTRAAIETLQAAGIRVSLDDFGRGYSNFTRLADLPVNTIKIDGGLVGRVTTEDRVREIVRATVEMANGLGCKTVAEGVETAEQASCLAGLGCTHLQGYFIALPMDKSALKEWVTRHEASAGKALSTA